MEGACARCGGDRGEGRWCATCGLDSTPTAATLPTEEAMEAGNRERAWFSANPERRREQEERSAAARERAEQADWERLSRFRPAGLVDYRDVSWRARLARGWLVVVAATTVLSAVLEFGHVRLLTGKTTAELDFDLAQRIDSSNATIAVVNIISLCAYLFSAVFFAAWTFRAYKNATALGAQHPRFGAGWAIGSWFVPILGMWRPKQIVDDIWRGSDPAAPASFRKEKWQYAKTPGLLDLWWGLYICAYFANYLTSRQPIDTIEQERTASYFWLGSDVLWIAAAAAAFVVVTRVTERQRARAAAMEALPAPSPVSGSRRTAATAPAT